MSFWIIHSLGVRVMENLLRTWTQIKWRHTVKVLQLSELIDINRFYWQVYSYGVTARRRAPFWVA